MTAGIEIDDLIVARATPPGSGALAIVRLDGAGAADAVARLFRPAGGAADPVATPRRMVFGRWVDPAPPRPGEAPGVLDEGLAVFFAAPRSFTGNDLAEFHCHGGAVPARRLIEAALAVGARLAEPGEFTRRAYLNGRLDLAQAEAVADLINAQTEAAATLAGRQLAGELSRRVGALRQALIDVAAELEARIDFPEEGLEAEDFGRLRGALTDAGAALAALLETRRRGRLLREGARVALIGRPNAGKSSLLNALARHERAIVTPHPGTTRDTIECTIDLGGMPLTLIDTAGLRASEDPIERLGIERTLLEIERADLVILVREAGASAAEPSGVEANGTSRAPDLVALNKVDLLPEPPPAALANGRTGRCAADGPPLIPISATQGLGLSELESAIVAALCGESSGGSPAAPAAELDQAVAVSLRHGELLARAAAALGAATAAFDSGLSSDLVMVDLREALDALGDVLGLDPARAGNEAILDAVFSRFCLGK